MSQSSAILRPDVGNSLYPENLVISVGFVLVERVMRTKWNVDNLLDDSARKEVSQLPVKVVIVVINIGLGNY